MGFDKSQVTELLYQAKDMVDLTLNKASNLKIGDAVKDQLYQSSSDLQALVNSILSKEGVVTDEQLNQLDEQMRLAKSRLLDAQYQTTMKNIKIYGGIGIIALGILWYLTREKK